jgi:hypothetical protein
LRSDSGATIVNSIPGRRVKGALLISTGNRFCRG